MKYRGEKCALDILNELFEHWEITNERNLLNLLHKLAKIQKRNSKMKKIVGIKRYHLKFSNTVRSFLFLKWWKNFNFYFFNFFFRQNSFMSYILSLVFVLQSFKTLLNSNNHNNDCQNMLLLSVSRPLVTLPYITKHWISVENVLALSFNSFFNQNYANVKRTLH